MSDLISRDALLELIVKNGIYTDAREINNAITNAPTIEQNVKCSSHPDAPHGFCRDASHTANRYVCECEGWTLPSQPQEQGEPVAWSDKGFSGVITNNHKKYLKEHYPNHIDNKIIPLYTTPPQPQTVKDALEKVVSILAKHGIYGDGLIGKEIRALIEKE